MSSRKRPALTSASRSRAAPTDQPCPNCVTMAIASATLNTDSRSFLAGRVRSASSSKYAVPASKTPLAVRSSLSIDSWRHIRIRNNPERFCLVRGHLVNPFGCRFFPRARLRQQQDRHFASGQLPDYHVQCLRALTDSFDESTTIPFQIAAAMAFVSANSGNSFAILARVRSRGNNAKGSDVFPIQLP